MSDGSEYTQPQTTTFTSVIYFHGMGSQRRFEETSRLIDAIDRYLTGLLYRVDPGQPGKGRLRGVRARFEPDRNDPQQSLTYIETKLMPNKGPPTDSPPTVRFYEVYWAPVMAGSHSPWRILKWMFGQVRRPFDTLRSPWRERQRLRRSALVEVLESPANWPAGTKRKDFERLVKAYDEFENFDALREHPSGSFDDFLIFLGAEFKDKLELDRLILLARAWKQTYVAEEWRHALVLATIALALLLSGAAGLGLILFLFQFVSELPWFKEPEDPVTKYVAGLFEPTFTKVIAAGASVLAFFGITGFLTNYMGDVEAWSAYEETNERHERRAKIIQHGTSMIEHVLNEPRCDRVVFVSHSLGSTIAHDSLLRVVRDNLARSAMKDAMTGSARLDKISHFVTMGSPIDKVEYFFESYRSDFHRYRRVVEEIRGDIGEAPFSHNRKPHIHWVNYWDKADLISGPLHSPANSVRLQHLVDNVEVSNLFFADPGASHSAYFEHRDVVGDVFDMIYRNDYSYQTLPLQPGQGYDYASAARGPGTGAPLIGLYLKAGLAAPWLLLCFAIGWYFGQPLLLLAGLAGSSIALLLLVVGYFAGRLKGHRKPL